MPVSECHLDAPRDLVRVRYPSFTGDVGGVAFVDGEAQAGMSARVAERLRGIFGAVFEVLGPWTDTPPPAATEPPAESSSSSPPQGASALDDDPGDVAYPGSASDLGSNAPPSPKPRGRRKSDA